MPFNLKKFDKAKFEDRTEAVPVPDMAEYFDEGEKPEIVVRGLTGAEVFITYEAAEKNRNIKGIMEKIASANVTDKMDAISAALGILDERTPEEMARRVEQLRLGSVSPELDQIQAAKFFENYPVEGITVTNAISRLTGKGRLPGESKPSGKKQTSTTP